MEYCIDYRTFAEEPPRMWAQMQKGQKLPLSFTALNIALEKLWIENLLWRLLGNKDNSAEICYAVA